MLTLSASGEAAIVEVESINVEGNLSTEIPMGSFVADGGGISEVSSLRFFPLGAGSRGGDRL